MIAVEPLIRGLELCTMCVDRLIGDEVGACDRCIARASLRALPPGDEAQVLRNAIVYGPEDTMPAITITTGDTVPPPLDRTWDRSLVPCGEYRAHYAYRLSEQPPRSPRRYRTWRSRLEMPRPASGWIVEIHGQAVGFVVEWPHLPG